MDFKLWDLVEAFGCRGRVISTTGNCGIDQAYPIVVKFLTQGILVSFTKDGKESMWHEKPSLVLIERGDNKSID